MRLAHIAQKLRRHTHERTHSHNARMRGDLHNHNESYASPQHVRQTTEPMSATRTLNAGRHTSARAPETALSPPFVKANIPSSLIFHRPGKDARRTHAQRARQCYSHVHPLRSSCRRAGGCILLLVTSYGWLASVSGGDYAPPEVSRCGPLSVRASATFVCQGASRAPSPERPHLASLGDCTPARASRSHATAP